MPKAQQQQQAPTVVSVNAGHVPIHRREDPPRDERRAVVRVRFREGAAPTVVAGQRPKPAQADDQGWVTLKPCYLSDVPRIEALIESDTRSYEAALKAHKKKLSRFISEHIPKSANRENPEVIRLISELERRYTGSVEAEFYSITGYERGLRPFLEVQVVESDLDPPLSREERQTKTLVESIVGRIGAREGQAHGNDAEIEELRRENAELRQTMAQMAERQEKILAALEAHAGEGQTAEETPDKAPESGKSKGRGK